MNLPTYDITTLSEIVKNSFSIREVLRKLGLSPDGGGTVQNIKKKIESLQIDTSHFTGQGHNKGKSKQGIRGNRYKEPTCYFNINGSIITSYKLKLKLFETNLKQKQCESCKLSEWLNEPIPLELDHINGNKRDNRFENLRILCPNCHAKTPTYRTKNWKIGVVGFEPTLEEF